MHNPPSNSLRYEIWDTSRLLPIFHYFSQLWVQNLTFLCLLGVSKSITGQCKMENVCLTITSWEIPCMNPVSYTQEWWLCSFSTNFLSCLSGQRTNSVLHQKYLECNKLLMKKKPRRNCRNSNCLQVMSLLEQTGHSMISGLSFIKIASYRVYAISRRGIEQRGNSFDFILVLIPR